MIKIENLSAETTLDAAALERIHGGGKIELKVWADPHERLSDRRKGRVIPQPLFIAEIHNLSRHTAFN